MSSQYNLALEPMRSREALATVRREPLRVAGLFAGIGGIELGLSRAGHRTTLFCENDPAAVAVLEARFPDIAVTADVRTLADVGDIDLIAAGFPCQDLSPVGTTQGMNGVKSSLVAHVFRLLRDRPVPWLLLENVPFMLQLAKGEALNFVVSELEKLNYHWAYRVIDSSAFGLPQRRERVFIVASQVDDPRRVLFSGNETPPVTDGDGASAYGFYWTEGNRGLGWAVDAIPTLKGGSAIGIASPPGIWLPNGLIGKPDIRDGERLQGFTADWTLPAEMVGRGGVRWRLVGNAVTVDVAEWLGERFRRLDGILCDGTPLGHGTRWPKVAWNVGQGRYTVPLSSWPVRKAKVPLNAFLRYPVEPLSERATAGFYARFTASSLAKPKGFVDALAAHLERVRSEREFRNSETGRPIG